MIVLVLVIAVIALIVYSSLKMSNISDKEADKQFMEKINNKENNESKRE